MNETIRQTKLIVDLQAIETNIKNIRNLLGQDVKLMPVVKANAYGTYLNEQLPFLIDQFDYIAVALVDEAIQIRNKGYHFNILVLNPILEEEIPFILKYNLIINGCDLKILNKINMLAQKQNKACTIHVELETGMGRTGVEIANLSEFIEQTKQLDNIVIEGVFSHFSSSSKDIEYSNYQINQFEKGLEIFKEYNIYLKYIHLCNSGAILNYPQNRYNMVRIGLMIYGFYPNPSLKNKIDLIPAITLKTKINFIKKVKKGTSIGYNRNFISTSDCIIATIPFGFADGLIGLETGEAYVIVNNQKAKIIAICMDNMMLDVSDIKNVENGTDVFIWDNKLLTVEEVANWCNGICNYEIISSLSNRIPREYI